MIKHLGRQINSNRIRWYRYILKMNKEKISKKVLTIKVKKKTPKREIKLKKGTTG
jgi:hypothetical protein